MIRCLNCEAKITSGAVIYHNEVLNILCPNCDTLLPLVDRDGTLLPAYGATDRKTKTPMPGTREARFRDIKNMERFIQDGKTFGKISETEAIADDQIRYAFEPEEVVIRITE